MGTFIFTAVLFIVVVGFLIVARRHTKNDASLSDERAIGTGVGSIVALCLFAALLAQAYVQVEPNHYQVQTFAGSVQGEPLESGWSFQPPWYSQTDFDCTTQTFTMAGSGSQDSDAAAISAATKDGSISTIDVTIRYACDGAGINELYTNYRDDFEQRIIFNDSRSVIRDVFIKYNALEGREQRQQLGNEIELELADRWEGLFIVDEVNIRRVDLQDSVQQAADAVLTAEASARERGFVLLEEEVNADIVRVQNQAVRDGQQIILCGGTITQVQRTDPDGTVETIERIIPNEGDDCEVQLSPELLQWKCLETLESIFSTEAGGTSADNSLITPPDCGLSFGQTNADLIPEPRVDVPVNTNE